MKTILKEILLRLKGSRKFYILFFAILTIFSAGIIVIISANVEFNNKINHYNQLYNNINYYQIGDNFVGEYEDSLNKKGNKYGKLLALYSELSNNDDFKYYIAYDNPIELKNFIGNDIFLAGYESGDYRNSKLNIEDETGENFSISVTKALWCSKEMFEYFDIKTYSGDLFADSEYEFKDIEINKQPVVLGYDYLGTYSIGDLIPCDSFFMQNGYLEVIGFLEKNSIVYSETRNQINLNRYMVVPSKKPVNFSVNEKNEAMYDFYTYIQCNGVAATKMSAEDLQTCISNICGRLDVIPSLYVKGALNQQSYITNLTQSELLNLIILIFLILYLFILFVMLTYTSSMVSSNLKYYSILYTYKYTYSELILNFIVENGIIMFSSFVLSALISTCISILLNIELFFVSYIISCSSITLMLVFVIILFAYKLKKLDLSEYIRKL